ncbi:hypothetical protein pb186bvf_004696 [Paramecium bursaria]
MLRKLGLLTEFCQQSMQHCFNFIYQDPIDQTGQLELKQYDTQKTPQQSRVQSMTQKMTQEEIPQQKQQKQDEDIDHDPFSEFQTKINFKSQIVSEIEKQPLKYAEEDIETDGKGWNDDEIVL